MTTVPHDPYLGIGPLWRLADPLTVHQAAALIVGVDPNRVRNYSTGCIWPENEIDDADVDLRARHASNIQTALAALANAINAGKLKATIRRPAWERGWDEEPGEGERFEAKVRLHESDVIEAKADNPNPEYVQRRGVIYRVSPDWSLTTVDHADLAAWLESKGVRTGFFFPNATDEPDYLDPNNPRYAPKLAAAVHAWLAVPDPGGKHPKQALMKWLREHAAAFGMTDEEGKPYETGIEETAKVANWQSSGGAPKTPGEK